MDELQGPNREGFPGERVPPDPAARIYASEQSAPDWRYFTQHSYAELAEGF